jgi:hypothetical protein
MKKKKLINRSIGSISSSSTEVSPSENRKILKIFFIGETQKMNIDMKEK